VKVNKDGILPCPGCGKPAVRYVTYRPEIIYVECTQADCHMSGPLGENVDEAISKWNKLPRNAASRIHKKGKLQPCVYCGHPFDHDSLGMYGCPNCHGEGFK
jgi:hypothetical protein